MLTTYFFRNPVYWIVPLAIQILSYWRILSKMGKRSYMAIIPVLGEMEMSTDLFRRMRSFWRPAAVAAAMFLTSRYLKMSNEYSVIMAIVALIVYGIFLIRLYARLAKQFGKGKGFTLGLILLPLIFLPILGFGKSAYLGRPEFKPEKERSPKAQKLRKAGLVIISVAEVAALVVGCFFITMLVHPLRPIAQYMMNDTISKLSSVTDNSKVVGRDESIGANYQEIVEAQRSREYFFPDHSSDSKVVVMEYIIGSNLEDGNGLASVNIAQMKDATAKGDGLDFVVQAGGSGRWFTDGIDDETVGRYVISGGKLETAEMIDPETCMSEPENLTDFITWTKKNYPADRYMLVLWDHGGGFASGYGMDDLNKRSDQDNTILSASEIIGAIRDADVKFDVIGFDACLMQDIEYANALEPYADFYLASEETEPGTGWFYTAGFGKLAADPAMSTEEFGKSMVASYDQSLRAVNDGEPDHMATLSLVDLTLVKPLYKSITDLYGEATKVIADSPAVFANMSAARYGAYQFTDEEQVDMVSFLTCLKKADFKQLLMPDEKLDDIITAAKACVVYRSNDSAEGVNGIAIDFPYGNLNYYSSEYEQLKAVKYTKERRFFDRFCSIMASQRMADTKDKTFFGISMGEDYTDKEWYIKGFEDYDTTDLFIDIPVTETEGGYLPELPDKTWDTILDCKVAAYLVTDDGLMYLGQEHFDDKDADGRPLVSMDGTWARVNGHLVCYETEEPLVTEDGTVYRGTVKARLNGTDDITLHLEWDPVAEGSEAELSGHVTGYSIDDEEEGLFFMKKGLEQFETGDTIEFLFDYYDEEGKLIKSGTYGDKLRVITDDRLTVSDDLFDAGTELQYFGVLTDVYQRDLITEEIREQVQ